MAPKVTLGGQLPKFWPKMTPNIGMPIASRFGPFDDIKWSQNIFGTKHDSISSKWIAKQLVLTKYMVTPGGGGSQMPRFWPKMMPNLDIMQVIYQGIIPLRPYLGLTFQPTGIARGQLPYTFAHPQIWCKFSKDFNGISLLCVPGVWEMSQGYFRWVK
jgi:hypothetical protein